MKQTNNLFTNSGIRDITPHHINFWHQIKNIFSKNNSFFTLEHIHWLALALSHYLYNKSHKPANILIARDTRISGTWIAHTLQNTFLDNQHHVYNINIVPTPFVAQAVHCYKSENQKSPFFSLGVMITASHNPAEYNGIKIFTPKGYLTKQEEIEISNIFFDIKKNKHNHTPTTSIEFTPHNYQFNFKAFDFYIHKLQNNLIFKNFKNIKMVVDCAHGATYQIAKAILKQYGFTIIMIHDQPNGYNINQDSGCSNPELLMQAVYKHAADWGCAFDGDGDRVIIVNNKGQIFDGDDIITIISQHPNFKTQKIIVGTIMSNEATEQFLTNQNKTFITTDVGERNIIETLKQYKAQLGAESCGHITIMKHAPCSDGIFATLMFFDTLRSQKMVFNHYPKHAQVHATISLKDKIITEETICAIKNKYASLYNLDKVIIRKSNTEPIIRIMTEHKNKKYAEQILYTIVQELKTHIES